ncbi:Peptidase C14 domain containing protein, partial [Asbolus verrucosus]
MNHSRRGQAVIFNHVNFVSSEHTTRHGSDKDRDDLSDVLRQLGFDVSIHDDLNANEIFSALWTVSQMDHSDADCLVIIVMTHGDNNKLGAKDRDYPTKTLWKYFSAHICPSLAGKPKLFFIQACRGQMVHPSHILKHQAIGVVTDAVSDDDVYYTIPIMADILVMYSTVDGFASWRDPENGSWFIQSLIRQLRKYHKTKDLLTILTYVNRDVAVNCSFSESSLLPHSECKQMCSIVSMLTRQLYFTHN